MGGDAHHAVGQGGVPAGNDALPHVERSTDGEGAAAQVVPLLGSEAEAGAGVDVVHHRRGGEGEVAEVAEAAQVLAVILDDAGHILLAVSAVVKANLRGGIAKGGAKAALYVAPGGGVILIGTGQAGAPAGVVLGQLDAAGHRQALVPLAEVIGGVAGAVGQDVAHALTLADFQAHGLYGLHIAPGELHAVQLLLGQDAPFHSTP